MQVRGDFHRLESAFVANVQDLSISTTARVASLHLHPAEAGEAMLAVDSMELVAGQGIVGNGRYFRRVSKSGQPGKRQVSLIEREQVAEHAVLLGLDTIPPGSVGRDATRVTT